MNEQTTNTFTQQLLRKYIVKLKADIVKFPIVLALLKQTEPNFAMTVINLL